MNNFIIVFLCISLRTSFSHAEGKAEYLRKRERVLEKEGKIRTGGEIVLTENEVKANTALMQFKNKEIINSMKKGNMFPPAQHFFRARTQIEKSDVFKIIQLMPKGAVLHVHDASMTDLVWLIKHATYLSECYMCIAGNGQLLFHYFKKAPPETTGCKWKQVQSERNASADPEAFDQKLYNSLSLVVENPHQAYPTQNVIWNRFSQIFISLFGLMTYAPVFTAYMEQALYEFYSDNVQYVEIRALMEELYDLDGTKHDVMFTIQKYKEAVDSIVKKYPDFAGGKLILSSSRNANVTNVENQIKQAIQIRQKYPNFVAGFDLVGQEDKGHSLRYHLEALLAPSQKGIDLPYFFHAGETDWENESVDENLVDALLLNTTRIGHGYAILKHPEVKRLLKQRDIAIEVNPISNQVLMLVDDLRNHPATVLLAEGFPVVISSDDPTLWGASGMSYDFYEAFMGMGGATADLRMLKKLAMDSIKYSAMSDVEKKRAFQIWQKKWNAFIEKDILEYFHKWWAV